MFWYIGAMVSIVLLIIGIILVNKSYKFETLGFVFATISIIFLILAIIIIPVFSICDKQEVNKFERQKEYIESHISKNDVEDAALTTKKIELNEWLYNAQYFKTNYSIFSFYPDEVLELKAIK